MSADTRTDFSAKTILMACGLSLGILPAAAASDQRADYRGLLEATGGAHVRMVWSQGGGRGKVAVMGLDTRTRTTRVLLPPLPDMEYHPRICTDGTFVLVNVLGGTPFIHRKCLVVDWNTGRSREFLSGRYSRTYGDWIDPDTGKAWIITSDSWNTPWEVSQGRATKVSRVLLEDPSAEKLIWDKSPISGFTLSGDGTKAGGLLPFNKAGVIDLEAGRLHVYGHGCFTSFASDNSYRLMHLEGNHRRIRVYDTGGANGRSIPIDVLPSVKGQMVWHTSWANNNCRFLFLMGPERGPRPQIILGRHDKDLKTFEHWLQVTDNGRHNGLPTAWIDPACRYRVGSDSPPAPEITEHPRSAAVDRGAEVTFSCSAIGPPDLTYQWRRNGAPIAGATSPSYTRTAATDDRGARFDCVVSNAHGSVTSQAATLSVTKAEPTEEDYERWNAALLERVKDALNGGRKIELNPSTRSNTRRVRGVDAGGRLMVELAPGMEAGLPVERLTPQELVALALAVIREGSQKDQCLAGFYLYSAGQKSRAETHLKKGGAGAAAVRALFE